MDKAPNDKKEKGTLWGMVPRDLAVPFSLWWPFLAGILAGLGLRFLFSGKPGQEYATMMGTFIYMSPVIVGAVTVYVAETIKRRSWYYYFWAPFIANCLYVIGTLIIMIEGLICAVAIVPLFAILGAVGGVIMGTICRLTNWPKHTIYSISILPFIFGYFETGVPLTDRINSVERSVIINAKPEIVWQQINNARDIQPGEVENAWAYRIGVPLPLTAITQQTPSGQIRKITMGKSVYFDQISVDWQENRYVRWVYHFYPDSFPPQALDDHVMIGGHYFDIKDTSYTLNPIGNATELKINISYRLSTRFNWYADPIVNFLAGDVEKKLLEFYRRRSEAHEKTSS